MKAPDPGVSLKKVLARRARAIHCEVDVNFV